MLALHACQRVLLWFLQHLHGLLQRGVDILDHEVEPCVIMHRTGNVGKELNLQKTAGFRANTHLGAHPLAGQVLQEIAKRIVLLQPPLGYPAPLAPHDGHRHSAARSGSEEHGG